MTRNAAARTRREGGSALIEVLVSVVLFSVGIVGLLRVLGTAVKDAGEIEYRATAATLADETLGLMWGDRANLVSYVVTDAARPELPAGTETVAVDGDVVTVTITWRPPGAGQTRSHVSIGTLAVN